MIQTIENILRRWRWTNVLAPMYAIYMIIWAGGLLFATDSYLKIAAYQGLFDFVPIRLWAVINVIVAVLVLYRDTPLRTLAQSIVVIFEGVFIAAATVGNPDISPLAGVRLMVIGMTLWILALMTLIGITSRNTKKK